MLYKKYIEYFTVSYETKAALLNNAIQLANQPETAQTKRATTAGKSATDAQTKKPSTFKLHPRRWAIILASVFLVLALVPTLYFAIPWGVNTLIMGYLTDMMVDMEGVTAFGIKREQTTQSARNAYANNGFGDFLSFGNYVAYADEPTYKNYLYKTTETYEPGKVEYGEGTIERVTFKKNTSKTEDVYDENGNLITAGTELTQDEINGQINKVYVGEFFTYMQFTIPVSESGIYSYRNSDGGISKERVEVRSGMLNYDEYGVANYDKEDYYSSELVQSFIIDNKTGYIYKIENIWISKILTNDYVETWVGHDKLANGFPTFDNAEHIFSKLSVNEDGTLSFVDVAPNKNIGIGEGGYTDKYRWTYIYSPDLNYVDEQNKVIFYSDGYKYVVSRDNRVFTTNNAGDIECEVIDGAETPVPSDLTVFNLRNILRSDSLYIGGYYKGHKIWNSGKIDDCVSFTDDVGELYWFDETTIVSMKDNQISYITLDLDACVESPRLNIPLSEFTGVEVPDGTVSNGEWRYSANYRMLIGNDYMYLSNVYYQRTPTGEVYCQLVKKDGKLKLVKLSDKTYTPNTFIFQPINK